MSDKIDKILELLTKKQGGSAQGDAKKKDPNEEKISELEEEIETLLSLVQKNETRSSIKQKIQKLQDQITLSKEEESPYMHTWYTSSSSSQNSKVNMQRRTTFQMQLRDALHTKQKLKRFPEDLHNILHSKVCELNHLLHTNIQKNKKQKEKK
jgi:hypothetical protein